MARQIDKITKLVIPCAGFGTRFLPATKAVPKPLLPVLGKPTVQWVVEEAVASGIAEIIFVIMKGHEAIIDHFKYSAKLVAHLKKFNKLERLGNIENLRKKVKFRFIYQKHFYGTGFALLDARQEVGNDPFALVWSDEIDALPGLGKKSVPRLKQMIDLFEKYKSPVLGVHIIDDEGTKKYGVIKGEEISAGVYKVDDILEKPGPKKAPSRIGSRAGYVLTPDIFDILAKAAKKLKPGQELGVPNHGISALTKKRPVYARLIKNELYDTGNVYTWLKANVELGKMDKGFGKEFKKYLDK
ncbi:UTP--glucose-1-phosphate uridylyltransferase [bacterium]|nr:UTP--glucose-1-phosphate uridylyltransferase [bacterium]|tara:strand:+ start:55 stop:951 length:897 start_codon:yes stop_codon:yes gene_type:complete